jgi:signal transduction histidine kinase
LVENLASNAAHHARTVVRFGVSEADGAVTLVVSDDGPGIPAADRSRVFDRFTRLDAARSRDDGGAGLGLAIVASIVEQHHGSVAIDDPPGGGARFTVVLPSSLPGPTPT